MDINPIAQLQGQNWVEKADLEIDYTHTLKKRKEWVLIKYPRIPLIIAALLGGLIGCYISTRTNHIFFGALIGAVIGIF